MNSYITAYDATTYFNSLFNKSKWNSISESDKLKLLTSATQIVDSLNYAGEKTDSEQELEFPRGGDEEVPQRIKDATCEIAYCIYEGFDPEYDVRNLNTTQMSFNQNRLNTDTAGYHEARVNGIPSFVAWDMLRPYLIDGREITLSRTN